jgi:hypothetical protein
LATDTINISSSGEGESTTTGKELLRQILHQTLEPPNVGIWGIDNDGNSSIVSNNSVARWFFCNPPDLMRKSARIRQMQLKPFFTPRGSFLVIFLERIWPYLRSGQKEIFSFLRIICKKIILISWQIKNSKKCKKKWEISWILLIQIPKPPESARSVKQKQTYAKLVKIRQKSARNWKPARNIFCPPDDFQIRQNCPNLAEKTAIWQRWATNSNIRVGTAWGRQLVCGDIEEEVLVLVETRGGNFGKSTSRAEFEF